MATKSQTVILARTKLADRPVVWKEAYTDRTLFIKRQFHEVLGPGSYFRFEGHDTDSGDEYFAIVGPAKVHNPKAEYFAGVRKLPANFSAGGLYFHDLKEAMEYAHDTWGVQIPQDMKYYDSKDLNGIGDKIDAWKETIEDNDEEIGALQKWYDSIKQEEKAMPVSEHQEYFYQQSSTYPFFIRVAMAKPHISVPAQWWDVDDIISGSSPSFQSAVEKFPTLATAKDECVNEKRLRRNKIAQMYGEQYATDNAGFYKIYLVNALDQAERYWIVSAGPYCGTELEMANDKFGIFTMKLNVSTEEDIMRSLKILQDEYADKYGIVLNPGDFAVTGAQENEIQTGTFAKGDVKLNPKKAIGKLRNSDAWKQSILETYGVDVNSELDNEALIKKLNKAQSNIKQTIDEYTRQLEAAYAVNKETGDAFRMQQPPPPSRPDTTLWPKKSFGGQRMSTTIKRQNFAGEAGAKIEQYGFDSIVEAVSYLNAKQFQGAPIGDLPDTTSADLRAAREAKQAADAAALETQRLSVPQRRRTKSPSAPATVTPPVNNVQDEKKEKVPLEVPDIKIDNAPLPNFDKNYIDDIDNFGSIANSSLLNMIKLAADLDSKGRTREAKEIHTILKKHIPL